MNAQAASRTADQPAQHCEALTARRAPEADVMNRLASFADSFGVQFASGLGEILGADKLSVDIAEPEKLFSGDLIQKIGPVAGNILVPVGGAGGRLLVSVALPPLMEQLAYMFGSEPAAGDEEVAVPLPRSLELLIAHMQKAICRSLSQSLGMAKGIDPDQARMNPCFRNMDPFPAGAKIAVVSMSFAVEQGSAIPVLFAYRASALPKLLDGFSVQSEHGKSGAAQLGTHLAGAIPMQVKARLVDMTMPAQRLMNLQPGTVLPIAVARNVPLYLDELQVASGTVGEVDDRIALQVDNVFLGGRKS